MTDRKTLIEVALPLPEINDASAYDKMPGIGPHPKGIHHWWARLPLPTARAVLFASVVTDPAGDPAWRDKPEAEQDRERERLFGIIRRMMGKKLHEHPEVYAEAQEEIRKHCGDRLPTVLDPFAGGGSIPLEANRLGFPAEAADLDPVAVLLNKCNLEIAPHWAGCPAVNPEARKRVGGTSGTWRGTQGLAADVRHYGDVIRKRAIARIGHLYPKVPLSKEHGGGEANVIAWIWARTVASPNPAARGRHVPLISTYWLSSKKGNLAWLEPVVDRAAGAYRFEIRTGTPADRAVVSAGTKVGRGGFTCLLTGAPIGFDHVREEGMGERLGRRLIAVVAEVPRGRVYVEANDVQEKVAETLSPQGYPDTELPEQALGFRVQNYGIRRHWQMFSPRQLTAMVTLSDLARDTHGEVLRDAESAGLSSGDAFEYASAVTTFLVLAVDRCADFNNALCGWSATNQKVMHLFGRGAIPMLWDFAEANTLGDSVGAWHTCAEYMADCVEVLGVSGTPTIRGRARQVDAATGAQDLDGIVVSTDPPYYDNIGYAALSDFFFVWLRRSVGGLYPELFGTMLAPKIPELTASPERFDGDKDRAKEHFESGFRQTFTLLRERLDVRFPLTVYYAFKQSDQDADDSDDGSDDSPSNGVDLTTGWETLLDALVSSGFQVTATWPVRASQQWRMRAMGSNALASYIVLACRPRPDTAPQIGRREFMTQLKQELPDALRHLQQGNVAPVDLAQAAIGPGMAVFSRYARVVESSGQSMSIRAALGMINQMLDEVLTEQEGDFDGDSRWAVAWFDQNGFAEGEFGVAETLSKAKNTSVTGMAHAGILASHAGKVRLLRPNELPADWDPATDKRLTAWEAVHHLVRVLEAGGESAAAGLVAKLGGSAEVARELAYRLFTLCERRKRPTEALSYNALVQSWPEIARLARDQSVAKPTQGELF
jgi:putative DNA methylase